MRTVQLAGVEVPRVGLGTNRLTEDHEEIAFVHWAVESGLRHIDTAHLYTGGASEQAIGAAGVAARDDVVVATKGGYRPGEGRPEALRAQIEQSLRSLGVEALDLWYLHRVDPQTPLEETLGAVREHVDRGDIRHVGLSAVSVEQIERARAIVPIAAVQNEHHLGERGSEDVIDHCTREGIVFVPFFPLRGGDRVAEEISWRHGTTPSAVKLAWLLRRSPLVLPIPGTLSLEHLRANLAALELELDDEDLAKLG